MGDRNIYIFSEPIRNEIQLFSQIEKKMTRSESERRMVISSQTCETKGWVDDNRREQCWKRLGGLAAEWADPIDETKWFGGNKGIFGSFCT